LSSEKILPDAAVFNICGRQHEQEREREFLFWSGVVEDPRHAYRLHAREPGDLGDACDER